MNQSITTPENLRRVEAEIKKTVEGAHPGVAFTNIWIEPHKSWCGGDLIDVWAIYDGETKDLSAPTTPSLRTLIQDILWSMDVDAAPQTYLVAKSDFEDSEPETV